MNRRVAEARFSLEATGRQLWGLIKNAEFLYLISVGPMFIKKEKPNALTVWTRVQPVWPDEWGSFWLARRWWPGKAMWDAFEVVQGWVAALRVTSGGPSCRDPLVHSCPSNRIWLDAQGNHLFSNSSLKGWNFHCQGSYTIEERNIFLSSWCLFTELFKSPKLQNSECRKN